jgi:hypothetical protein
VTYRVDKIDLLNYALEGAYTIRGTQSGNMSEEEEEGLDLDIAELKKRLAVALLSPKSKEKTCEPKK